MPGTLDHRVLHDARLLITEAVANSVLHADAPDGAPIDVSAGRADGLIWFEVGDAGRRTARDAPRLRARAVGWD